MNLFIITYDLIAPDKDYNSLYQAIKAYGSYAHLLESVWIIKSSSTSKGIRDHLKVFLDNNDKLFVSKLFGESAWRNLSTEVSDWLHAN